jgi:hypothetical protein
MFPTSGDRKLESGKTYFLRYTVSDQLGVEIDAKSLTVKTTGQPTAPAKPSTGDGKTPPKGTQNKTKGAPGAASAPSAGAAKP